MKTAPPQTGCGRWAASGPIGWCGSRSCRGNSATWRKRWRRYGSGTSSSCGAAAAAEAAGTAGLLPGRFAALADALAQAIRDQGGEIRTGVPVSGLAVDAGRAVGVATPEATLAADAVIATPALPIVADLVAPHAPGEYVDDLRRIRYLANVCVVLELDRSLSDIYWLNVNDPGFPFVGSSSTPTFEPASTYAGRHIVYLSRYLPESDALWRMPDEEAVAVHARTPCGGCFPT